MQNLDIWFFWNIFRKRWEIILLAACLGAVFSGVYSKLFITPVYSSSVVLYLGQLTEASSDLEETVEKIRKRTGSVGGGLSLGASLQEDCCKVVYYDQFQEAVEDEIAKTGRWRGKGHVVGARPDGSRGMVISVNSDNPVFSQQVAGIYARVFIKEIPRLIRVNNVRISREPTLNMAPVSPNIRKNIMMGLFAGFAVSFGLFIAWKILDRSISTPREVEQSLQLPVVGTVHKDLERGEHKKFSKSNGELLFSGTEDSESNRNQISEDFRVFRVNLINRKPADKKDGSVIAVTSSKAKEGKTFCTTNLGAALAEAGYKVLLVDCDTGERGLQNHYGKPDDKGLMNILAGEKEFDQVVKRNLNNLNMDVLFCGDKQINTANLMISPKFKALVEKLKKQYDYAFLDISTNLGAADIVSAGSSADSVLLLVRAGKTRGDDVKQTVEALKRAQLNVSGVILNGVDEEQK